MAKFKIRRLISLSSRKQLGVAGDFTSGVIHIGDTLCLKKKKYKLHGIEYLDFVDRSFMVVLMIDATKSEIEPFIGETVIILPTNGSQKKRKES